MPIAFVDEAAKRALREAIKTVETASAAEIVIALRQASAPWHHVNALGFAVAAATSLGYMLYAEHGFSTASILIDPFIAGGVVYGLVGLVAPLKRWLTPKSMRRRAVLRAAQATFIDRGIHDTTRRAGILVYISWLEQLAVMVPDIGVIAAVDATAWADAMKRIEVAGSEHGVDVAAAIVAMVPMLTAALPHHAGDANELPDELDNGAP